ncbi:MAG: TRAP transporter substrate-binding protein DctP [Rhodospirillales bacterium]|nr:TRAP transporter substrate-binding protein DctP [Rhodospirillales bacterium]
MQLDETRRPSAPGRIGANLLALAILFLIPCAPALAAHYTLRLATWGSPAAPQVSAFVPAFTKLLAQESHGAITVQHFPAGSLVKEQVVPQSVETRVTDISLGTIGSFTSIAPPAAVMNTIFFRPPENRFEQAVGPGTPLFKALDAALRKHGMLLLALLDNGPPMVVSHVPMTSPAAFKGRTVRAYDRLSTQIIQALGGAPSTISVSDVYPALQRGTVSAAIGGIQGEIGLREYEVAKYLLDPNGLFSVGVTIYVMNAHALRELPKPLQQAVITAGAKAGTIANKAIIASFKSDLIAMQQHGMTVTVIEPGTPAYQAFAAALAPLSKAEQKKYPPALVAEALRASQ